MIDQMKEEDNQTPLSDKFTYFTFLYLFSLECIKNSDVKVSHKYTLGDLSMQTFCVRFDPNDKYIAAGIVMRLTIRMWGWNY